VQVYQRRDEKDFPAIDYRQQQQLREKEGERRRRADNIVIMWPGKKKTKKVFRLNAISVTD
jgi:hypothetical protein